jgi:outer membrane protein assembly factor BamB
MHTRHLAVLMLGTLAPVISAAEWTRFRGPDGLGTAADKDVPVTFGPKENVLWKTEIPGKGNSSPIVSKGKVFLETAAKDASSRSLVCVDAKTGKIDWKKDLKGAFAKTHDLNSLASSTPAADGERVYAVFWDGKHISLTAWDYAGKQLWNRDLGGYVSQHGPGLSPMVVGDRVILNVDQDDLAEVMAFDAKTGNPIWKKSRAAFRASYPTPFLLEKDGKQEVIVSSTAGVTAYDPKDGAVIWNWTWIWKPDPKAGKKGNAKGGPGGPLRNVGGPIYHDGMIYAISGDGGGDRCMVAIKAGPSGDITENGLVWEKKKETPYVPMALAHGDYVFWVTDKENKAVCVEAKTGNVVWSERLGGTSQVTASPVLIDGKIYSVTMAGRVYVFDAAPKFNLLAENDLKEEVEASPAVADGKLFIRGATHLICIGKK